MLERMIIDADLCIKLGSSDKYHFLLEVLPAVAKKICMHSHAFGEVRNPMSAQRQLVSLVSQGTIFIVNETELGPKERTVYDMTYNQLGAVMIDPRKPNKNKGEICSLAYAKVKDIPIFATDECDLQPIIDKLLNTGMNDIHCLRIIDIINMAKDGQISLPRKSAKAIWVISGKNKDDFDRYVWPILQQPVGSDLHN